MYDVCRVNSDFEAASINHEPHQNLLPLNHVNTRNKLAM